MRKTLVRSWRKSDFEIQTFRCGGNGGQNVNKRDTGVRIIYRDPDTGETFVAEGREHRTQAQNKKSAFLKLAKLIRNHYYPPIPKERAPNTERVRTYHEIRGTVKDERTGLVYDFQDVVNGNGLGEVIEDCIRHGSGEK